MLGDEGERAGLELGQQVKVDPGEFPAGYAFSGRSLDLDRGPAASAFA